MAGHSQFKNIMHRKGAQDAKRAARCLTKLSARNDGRGPARASPIRQCQPAAARGRSSPRGRQNMPKDTIERAIKRGCGRGGRRELGEEVRYEGFGPGGVAIIVEALTDNRNRTAGDIRSLFGKNGGTLGETNSVALPVRPGRRDLLSGQGRPRPTRCSRRRWKPAPRTSSPAKRRPRDHHLPSRISRRCATRWRRSSAAPRARRPGVRPHTTVPRRGEEAAARCSSCSTRSTTMTTSRRSPRTTRSPTTDGRGGRLTGRARPGDAADRTSIPDPAPTGWGVIEVSGIAAAPCRQRLRSTSASKPRPPTRLTQLYDGLEAVIERASARRLRPSSRRLSSTRTRPPR